MSDSIMTIFFLVIFQKSPLIRNALFWGLALWCNMLSCRLQHQLLLWSPVQGPNCSNSDSGPNQCARKSSRALIIYVGDLEGAFVSWLLPGPAPPSYCIYQGNEPADLRNFSLSLSNFAFEINRQILFKKNILKYKVIHPQW